MELSELVRLALAEDVAARDLTTLATVRAELQARGTLLAKQELVLSGLEVVGAVFRAVDEGLRLEPALSEGGRAGPGTIVATVGGRARGMLSAERVALNFLQRLSGVATLTRRFVEAVSGTRVRIRDTRKTTPLMRVLEKKAVEAGGGVPHRAGLDESILVKENHARLLGSVAEATRRARGAAPDAFVEVEVERLDQVEGALLAGAQMILLDNFTPDEVRRAVQVVGGRVPVEVSGGVNLSNVAAFAAAGPDYIAIGALTHSAPAVDISLEIEPA